MLIRVNEQNKRTILPKHDRTDAFHEVGPFQKELSLSQTHLRPHLPKQQKEVFIRNKLNN